MKTCKIAWIMRIATAKASGLRASQESDWHLSDEWCSTSHDVAVEATHEARATDIKDSDTYLTSVRELCDGEETDGWIPCCAAHAEHTPAANGSSTSRPHQLLRLLARQHSSKMPCASVESVL